MIVASLMALGAVAVFVSWRLIVAGRGTPWSLITPVTAALGALALASGRVGLSPRLRPMWAVPAGIGAGVAFYLATTAFVLIVRRWPVFDRHVAEIYDQRRGLPLGAAILLAAVVTAPAEEVFWRGLFQGVLAARVGWWGASALTLVAYVAAGAGSGSLPIVAGTIVGGAVWGALAGWTHGVLAGIACHVVWTALMVLAPPGGAARRIEGNPRLGTLRSSPARP